MGQTPSNCLAFCKEITNDDGHERIEKKAQKIQAYRNDVKSSVNCMNGEVGTLRTEIINIKKLSTEYAIYEEDVEEDSSIDTGLLSGEQSPNGVKVVAKSDADRRQRLLEELGLADAKNSTKGRVLVSNSFWMNKVVRETSTSIKPKSMRKSIRTSTKAS